MKYIDLSVQSDAKSMQNLSRRVTVIKSLLTETICIKKMATRIITAYNSANSYQIIIILISQETLFFCLSNDVFFVEIEKVEEEEIEKKDSEKLIIFLTIN